MLFCCIGITACSSLNQGSSRQKAPGPKLVFSDEFNTNGAPDSSKWKYETGNGEDGWGNKELQYYTNRPQNVIVQDGVLKRTALKENYMGSAYKSARLLTRGKYSFKYGRIEVRAKFPAAVGTWPAAWMLGDNIGTAGWPDCGETDIVEHLGRDLGKIYGTLHYPGHSGGNADGKTIMIPDAMSVFHTYTVDWSADALKIYVDDRLYHTVVNTAALPFNQPFFIILNMAMGGNFGGAVDPAFSRATYQIDYVRVYQ